MRCKIIYSSFTRNCHNFCCYKRTSFISFSLFFSLKILYKKISECKHSVLKLNVSHLYTGSWPKIKTVTLELENRKCDVKICANAYLCNL